ELNKALRKWEHIYDTVRPHQSLGYLAPAQFLQQYHHNRKGGDLSLFYWTSTRL
ncbi:MAG: integrase core domain-containing protein, partial [Candidatus Thorarchaeota archaeon]